MAIDPMGPGGPADPSIRRGAERLERSAAPAPRATSDSTRTDAAVGDTVELSAEAIRLAAGEDIPQGTLSAERLAEITERIASGRYDSAAAREAIARGIAGELS
jgi:anti-sigma28 factor (negative regulator of flagellin synthesis)